MRKTVFFFLILLISATCEAATYWVDPAGVENTNCDAISVTSCGATACKSLEYLIENAGATINEGDTIKLCPGTYDGTSGLLYSGTNNRISASFEIGRASCRERV